MRLRDSAFAPEIVAPTLVKLAALHVRAANPYGFKSSFKPEFKSDKDGDGIDDPGIGWVSRYHFGINEGPTVLMIENYRSGLIWSLMKKCAYLEAGLRAAGFTGDRLG